MKSISQIEEICGKYKIENYTINEDGSIDVDGGVDLSHKILTELPLNFNKVTGDFYCIHNSLTTLKGSPKYVGGGFYCNNNSLTSLEFGPKEVGSDFALRVNPKLTSLKGCPEKVGGYFDCDKCGIIDLEGISDDIGGYLYCDETPIGLIIGNVVDMDFIRAFNIYKVIKGGKVILKRLKYVMETFNMEYDLEKIKERYEIN